MGKPIKVMVKDQSVFVCCQGCEKAAKHIPTKPWNTVKNLKTANVRPLTPLPRRPR